MATRPVNGVVIKSGSGNSQAPIAAVADGSVTLNADLVDITEVGMVSRAFFPAAKSGTATLQVFYDQDATTHSDLETAFSNGSVVSLQWIWHSQGNNNASANWSATALISSMTMPITVGDVLKLTVEFQLTGATTVG